ncbi:Gx transporter family protein [candidate division KSB1 bacterium]|nr:Gx transporter family protein [candidate division KSB1 bacterium]
MPLPDNTTINNNDKNPVQRLVYLALFTVIGLVLFIAESYIPRPLPWVKPGLANLATLLALYIFNYRSALIVVILRVFLGALLLGTFSSPAFMLSLGGGLVSATVMWMFQKNTRNSFSVIGVSVFGSISHVFTQLLLTMFLLVKSTVIIHLLPVLLLPAVVSGLLVGWVTAVFLGQLKKTGLVRVGWYSSMEQ